MPACFRRRELARDVVGLEADVVHAFAALVEKPRHRAFGIDRLEELDLRVADGEQRRPHTLVTYLGGLVDVKPENVAVEAVRLLEAANHDPDVVDPL